ncbi:hypothetical protein Goshw_018204 [Gossypium schwendimanii]|uniref:Uncharacterized protein n=1 Tax=Gossypium schwendimanii TaxID=34291 RepID=A0A7J9M589_GOSSC|nr:hypothetical protein [Gossypium schwendimanii]
MKFGMGTLDDMDHLKNKCNRSVAYLLQDQFGLPLNLVTSTPLTTTYESFSGLHYFGNPITQS